MKAIVAVLVLALLLPGCSTTRLVADPRDKLLLRASADLNPDAAGRPSPLVIKVLELSSRSVLDTLDFDTAWDNTEVVLRGQLLSSVEFVLLPRQTRQHRIELQREARFIAVIAAYRDIDRARWKLIYPVNPNWFQKHRIALTGSAVTLEK